MAIIPILSQIILEYLKDPFLDLCCFCYIINYWFTEHLETAQFSFICWWQ